MIDNYDSFTYNLYQYIGLIVPEVLVFRNDKITVDEIAALNPDAIVISPGPKQPEDAGISKQVISRFGEQVKILGVCLGHQCINEVFGGKTVRSLKVWHGKTTTIQHDGKYLFKHLPEKIDVARYHSLMVDRASLSPELEVSAWTADGVIMAIRHKRSPIVGVQFHPESFLTQHGFQMIRNFFRETLPGEQIRRGL